MTRSNTIETHNSIPQGSVLGSILFLIYINDLPKLLREPCVLFADDISLLTSCKTEINLNNNITDILNRVSNWMTQHNLEINYKKTKLMQFRPYQKKPLDIKFSYNNICLECVDSFTLLGIDIDSYVNWKCHVKKLTSKLSSFVYALREIKKVTDLKTALSSYYAFAFSYIKYGILLWGYSTDALDVFIYQKKCIRILANIKEPHDDEAESCKPHFVKLKILTLTSLYILEACKFVRQYPELFTKKIDIPRKYPNRQNHNKLVLPMSKLKMHTNGPNKMAIKTYNRVPDKIKDKPNNIFINLLKDILIKKCYYNLNEFLDDQTL